MKNIIVITIKLLIITIVSGLALGAVNYITVEPIANQMEKEANQARQAAFSGAASFDALDIEIPEEYAIIHNVYNALDSDSNVIGIVANITTSGFNSGLNLTIGIGADGYIKGVIFGDNTETPGLGAKAAEPWFQEQYQNKPYDSPLNVVKSQPLGDYDIQAITSATITTKGVTDAVNTVTDFYKQMLGGTL
ncbi:MAG: FMN-binding protein [Christensenellales bacterium]|jgi:electron transport complex protein RnfG